MEMERRYTHFVHPDGVLLEGRAQRDGWNDGASLSAGLTADMDGARAETVVRGLVHGVRCAVDGVAVGVTVGEYGHYDMKGGGGRYVAGQSDSRIGFIVGMIVVVKEWRI